MFKFSLAGRDWHWPKITARVLTVLRDQCGLDLRGLLRKDSEPTALALQDDELVRKAFLILCAGQIQTSGLSHDDIEEGWDGDVNQAARESLVEAFFTFSQGPKKAAIVMERMRAAGQ